MTKIKTLTRTSATLLAAFLMMGAAPAVAQHGAPSTSGSGDTSSSTPASPPTVVNPNSGSGKTDLPKPPTLQQRTEAKLAEIKSQNTETENEPPKDPNHIELHQKGEALLAEMRKEHGDKTRTPEERKKQCEAHKDGLTNKFSHISTNAQKTQDRIDKIYAKGQAYAATQTTLPTNYTTLTGAADAAKADVITSITALKAVTPTIDCNNATVASDIAKFKAAAQDTRDKLKTYKAAVKAVLQSLDIPKPETPSTTPTPTAGGTN